MTSNVWMFAGFIVIAIIGFLKSVKSCSSWCCTVDIQPQTQANPTIDASQSNLQTTTTTSTTQTPRILKYVINKLTPRKTTTVESPPPVIDTLENQILSV
jgi:hypothetical protein